MAKTGPDSALGPAAISGDTTGKEEAPAAAEPSPAIRGGARKEGALVVIRGGARKEGAPVAASPPKGEERALAAEPSGGTARKREQGAPAMASRPHGTEPSSSAAGKGEEEAAVVMKVKTPPAAEPPGANPSAPVPDLVAAVLDPATTVTRGPP
ncbi:hypothetical protein GUJ93_ZPchr0016g2592 [Zizania palustris]|uniref:Uncharacterized protein n=1 Tax=Zizania palustris TaxID=103762 RepID=A0A8J5TM30_ZIZPA|nr:hypothetical protein GUJ93_ZPchr0016g2592 [Zizania palustris]